jgi:predicted SAM-dependent methyltransferase
LKALNLACGSVFIDNDEWVNVDYTATGSHVIALDLLRGLPFPSSHFDLIYCSHFLEHLPRLDVNPFLRECRRVLKPGGTIRLVLPDCQEMFSSYLDLRSRKMDLEADFVLLEIIDQCVRRFAGGELGFFYSQVKNMEPVSRSRWVDFIAHRTGETVVPTSQPSDNKYSRVIRSKQHHTITSTCFGLITRLCRRVRFKLHQLGLLLLLPAFRRQNVSLTPIGEKHLWLWDYHQLKNALISAGFDSVLRQTHLTSRVDDFPFCPLDATSDNQPRMGAQSMYIEATNPD